MNPRCTAPALLCAGLLAATDFAAAAVVTVPAQADTSIRELLPLENNGVVQSLKVGTHGPNGGGARQRGLFRFDVAGSVPAGAVVTSARLTLTVSKAPNFEIRNFQLHRQLTAWRESTATWLERDAGQSWSEPGGAAGVDYAATASAVTPVAGPDIVTDEPVPYTWESTPQLVADVQAWLDNPAANFGWMLRQSDETITRSARKFLSRESASDGPALEITFTEPFRIDSTAQMNNQFCLTFAGRAGRTYRIDHRAEVGAGSWAPLITLPTATADGPVTVCVSMAGTRRFYRVADITP